MNQKLAKRIRKTLRAEGADVRHAEYDVGMPYSYPQISPTGQQHHRAFLGHVTLKVMSGRHMYKKWKKVARTKEGLDRLNQMFPSA